MTASKRGGLLTTFAVLFALLAVSNLLKPLQIGGAQTGFVLFGTRLSGTANTVAGPLFGIYLAIYAAAIFGMRRFALPMAHAYATYVVINLILFQMNAPKPEGAGVGQLLFGIVYAVVAIGVSVGTAITLTKRKADLR